MKKLIAVIAVIITTLGGIFMVANRSQDNNSQTSLDEGDKQSKYDPIKQEIKSGKAVLLDVREKVEWNEGHINEAILLPLTKIEAGAKPDVDTTTKVYLYCRSGNRAQTAANILQKEGYQTENLGGLDDVIAIGGTSVK